MRINKKINYLACSRLPSEKAHGYQIMKMCSSFADLGFQVKLFVPYLKNPIKEDPFAFYGLKQNFSLSRSWAIDLKFLNKKWPKFTFFIKNASFLFFLCPRMIFWSHSRSIIYSRDLLPTWLAKLLGFTVIFEAHRPSKSKLVLLKKILEKVDYLIANSRGTASALVDLGLKQAPAICANGVDLADFKITDSKNEIRQRLGLPLEKKIILYSGHLYDWKGIKLILKSATEFEKDQSVIFVLLGGLEADIKKYRKILDEKKIRNVLLLGLKPKKEVPYFLKAADVLLLSLDPDNLEARKFTSPIKLFEYLTSQRPVVAADTESIRNLVSEREVIFYNPHSADDLSAKLQAALRADNQPRIEAGFALASENTWLRRAEKISQLAGLIPASLTEIKSICYFGDFDPAYSRNRVIIKGLRENKIEVLQCCTNKKGWSGFLDLRRQLYAMKIKPNALIVGYSDSRWLVPAVRLLWRGPLIWDAFYSLFETFVLDRALVKKNSLKAWFYKFIDWFNCSLSDRIILDTNCHIDFFSEEFRQNKGKFIQAWVGTDTSVFYPSVDSDNNLAVSDTSHIKVGFWGKFIPLQGIEYIIKAAKLLEKDDRLKFVILGSGQDSKKINALARELKIKNVEFLPRIGYDELPDKIKDFDICLGIFGKSEKAQLVIPNKVYEAVAMKKPVITGETSAIKELFKDNENIMFCRVGDATDLAQKILKLKRSPEFRLCLAEKAFNLFQENCQPKLIAKEIIKKIMI